MDEYPLGSLLRDKRTSLEIDVLRAAEQTGISPEYLRALEEEEFHRIPGDAYVKGFLRTYAAYMGLNPDSFVQLYEERYCAGSQRAQASMRRRREDRWDASENARGRASGLKVGLAVCAAIVLFWLLYHVLVLKDASF